MIIMIDFSEMYPGVIQTHCHVTGGLLNSASNHIINLNYSFSGASNQNQPILRIYSECDYVVAKLLPSSLAVNPYYLQLATVSSNEIVGQYNVSVTIESPLFDATQIVQFAYNDVAS